MSKLLVVDDEQSICWGLSQIGKNIGHEVITASSAEQALKIIDNDPPDMIVLDVRLPGMDGLSAISEFHQRLGQIPIIVITAYGDLETAISAIRNGAFEYIVKPFDVEKIQNALTRAILTKSETNNPQTNPNYVGGIVGNTPAMQEVFKQIALTATSNTSVLICGESGTGKELIARAIHRYSSQANGLFVAAELASYSPMLAELELFGYVKGAFPGADENCSGLIAKANGGTLFLSEIEDIPLSVQAKLLRALEYGDFIPVGSSQVSHSDIRVISSVVRDPYKNKKTESLRSDLLLKLGSYRINVPPLRDRLEDLVELSKYFLNKLAHQHEIVVPRITDSAIDALLKRTWRGNIRELRNVIEHAVVVTQGGIIHSDSFPEQFDTPQTPGENNYATIANLITEWAENKLKDPQNSNLLYEQMLHLVEPSLLKSVLKHHGGQCSAAARCLGIHRTTLRKKLDTLDL